MWCVVIVNIALQRNPRPSVATGTPIADGGEGGGIGKGAIPPLDPAYFIPDRFKGKTIVITGFARGMGQAAALRAVRESANVFGIDLG